LLNFYWTFKEASDGAIGLNLLNWLHLLWWFSSDNYFLWLLNHIQRFLRRFLNIEIRRGISQSSILVALRAIFLQISKFIRHLVLCGLRPLECGNHQRFLNFKLSDVIGNLPGILIKSIYPLEIVHRSVVTPHFRIGAEVALCPHLTILHSFICVLIVF